MTPLVVAKNKKDSLNFYTTQDFEEWASKTQTTKWNIEYKKGLAALEDTDYEAIIESPVLLRLNNDAKANESLDAWFGDNSSLRKEKLLNF